MKILKLFLSIIFISFIFSGCGSEKKAIRYKNIYEEKPAIVFAAKPVDYTPKKGPKERNAKKHNLEIENSNIFFHQSLISTLGTKGYYVIPYFNTEEILKHHTAIDTIAEQDSTVLKVFSEQYDIDAVLFTTIFRWKESETDWSVFIEYKLRSTKTNNILFHAKCKGVKYIPINSRGVVAIATFDRGIQKYLEFDPRTLNKMILFSKVNDFVLKNLPNGKSHKDFEADMKRSAIPEYLEFYIDEQGAISVKSILPEQFENEWFLEEE